MTEFFIAMIAGLLGGVGHCSGMCGPIVAAFSMRDAECAQSEGVSVSYAISRGTVSLQVYYNAGRVITYTALGALVGGVGSFVTVASAMEGAQYALMSLTGAVMFLVGASMVMGTRRLTNAIERHGALVMRGVRRLLALRSNIKYLLLGLLLGLLPCGLSYTMLIGAAGSGGVTSGALSMLGFGLGTVPAMFIVGMLAGRLGAALRGWIYRAGALAVAMMGLVYIYRGVAFYAHL